MTNRNRNLRLLALLLVPGLYAAIVPPRALADTYQWQGAATGGNAATDPSDPTTLWLTPANWSGGAVPGAGDTAYLTLTNSGYVNAQTASVATLYLDGTSSQGALHLVGGVTLSTTSVYAGNGSGTIGNIVQDNGTNTVQLYLNLAFGMGSIGNYTLNAGTLGTNFEFIGSSGTGTFTQTGGTHTVSGSLYLAYFLGSSGCYTLAGGTLAANGFQDAESIGYYGTGTFYQTGGTHTVSGYLYLGEEEGGCGSYTLGGGTLAVGRSGGGGNEYIGLWGTGTFTQTGGTHTVNNELYLSYFGDSSGSYTLSGGTLTVGTSSGGGWGNEFIGKSNGTFNQTGGTHIVTNNLVVGFGNYGAYTLGDGTLTVGMYGNTGYESIGNDGTGTFIQTGGTHTAGYLSMGIDGGSTGSYTLGGGTLTVTGDGEDIGVWSTGTFLQTGGTHTVNGTLNLAVYSGSTGSYTLGGGTLIVGTSSSNSGTEYIGYSGTGTFTQTGGSHTVTGELCLGVSAGAVGNYQLDGGTLSAGTFRIGGAGTGTLNVTNSLAQIYVTQKLAIGPHGTILAAPGTMIQMTGADFENQGADPCAQAGLANLTLDFEGGAGRTDTFEVSGACGGGFTDNFALAALVLGGSDVGRVRLVDLFDNGGRGLSGQEALFVGSLAIGVGSQLDLNGLHLYVEGDVAAMLDAWIADGRLIDSTGAAIAPTFNAADGWTETPEPGTLMLLALGGLAVLRSRRHK